MSIPDLENGEYLKKLVIKNVSTNKIGLCVGWNMVEEYLDVNADILGTLYSKAGADLLIRNLYRCKNIVGLIILDTNPLGYNGIGDQGLNYLYDFLFKSTYKQVTTLYDYRLLSHLNVIYIDPHKIEMKINGYITENISVNVTVEDLNEMVIHLRNSFVGPERTAIFYDYPTIDAVETLNESHETHGTTIYGNDLFDSWKQVLEYVYRYGTDNGVLRQFQSIHWSFNSELTEQSIKSARKLLPQTEILQMIGIDEQRLSCYVKSILSPFGVQGASYTYGQRLLPFMEPMLKALLSDINTRHAYATTIWYDVRDTQPPCLVYLQFLYQPYDRKMNLYVTFRSHDLFKAGLPNAVMLHELLSSYTRQLGVEMGIIEITSISAHIYLSNVYDVNLFLKCINQSYHPDIHSDPRGYVVISSIDNRLRLELKNNKTHETSYLSEGTPYQIFNDIMSNKVIISTEHLTYIYQQLFKDNI
jgi:thymidylate synthase